MAEVHQNQFVLHHIEQALARHSGEYEFSNGLFSSSNCSDKGALFKSEKFQDPIQAKEDIIPHTREDALTGTIRAHAPIYVVNEQIVHANSTWSKSLCAFGSLQSANTDARTRAIFDHAKGDESVVQVRFCDGYGTWTTILETDCGCITKSVFVNAINLQHLVNSSVAPVGEPPVPEDRPMPSNVPGPRRLRQIQAFRSTDSIRAGLESPRVAQGHSQRGQFQHQKLVLRDDRMERNHIMSNARGLRDIITHGAAEQMAHIRKGGTVSQQPSVDDLRDFASLHILL